MTEQRDNGDAERLLLVAPTRRDAEVTCALLHGAGLRAQACPDLHALAGQIEAGVGAVMLTDLALLDAAFGDLIGALQRQPAWSDVPVVLLMQNREHSPASARLLGLLSNVTLLDRPTSVRTMISAVQAALRGRRRQYEIRDHIEAQNAAEQALREADQRKDEFLATLAHELRNPLAPIRTGLQLIAKQPFEPGSPLARLPSMMERQLGLLVKLIDDLLDVSRISTGKLAMRRETVDMRAIAQAAIEGSQPALDAGGHQFRAEVGDRPLWVLGDHHRLAQVVSNLLNNAAKYTPAGGRITLTLEQDGGDAVIRVQDDGVGIAPEMLDRVFGLFAQLDGTLQHAQGGLGIGLSLVRRIVALHDGSVRAESPGLGRGSTFTVRLPIDRSPHPVAAVAAVDAAVLKRPIRVLVVDDNTDAADTLGDWLSQIGCSTRVAYDGETALQTAADFEPELVLCDIGLPGIDGHAVATRMRHAPKLAEARLVALTGWGSDADRERTRVAGFDQHLTKPVSVEALANILAQF